MCYCYCPACCSCTGNACLVGIVGLLPYTDTKSGRPIIEYGIALINYNLFLAPHSKAMKRRAKALLFHGVRERTGPQRFSQLCFPSPPWSAMVFGILSIWQGQLMLECGIVLALTMSALSTLQKPAVKLCRALEDRKRGTGVMAIYYIYTMFLAYPCKCPQQHLAHGAKPST